MRNKKLFIDILLFFTLLIAFISGMICSHSDSMVVWGVHVLSSMAFFILIIRHLRINGRGWFDAGRKLFIGEKYRKVRLRYILDWLLLIVWIPAVLTGLPSNGYKLGGEEFLLPARNAHSILSVIGVVLIGIHIFQHIKQIKTYLKK